MTNFQLWLAMGTPILFNLLGFMLLNSRLTDLRDDMNKRFDAFEKLLDTRVAELERRIGILERKVS